MALATRPKPKAHHRKRQAKHHKQTKHYAKAYWPYLPALAVVIGGAAAMNKALYNSSLLHSAVDHSTTRVEALTGSAWSLVVVVVMAAVAAGIFLFRHAYQLQRVLNRGEAFVVHHPWFDVALIGVLLAAVLLTRSVMP